MLKRFTFLLFGLTFALLTLLSTKAFATGPTFTITNVVNECNGDAGGSFNIVVTAATGTTLSFNIFGPGPPFADIVSGPITGVTLPYTFSVTGASAGSYTIIVKDIAAAPPQFQTIVSYSPISISAQTITDNTVCAASAGAIDITVTGGSGTYKYLWSNAAITEDISALTSGLYSVTITDPNSSCSLNQSFQVKDPQPVDFAISTSTPTLCSGGNIIINAGQPTASDPGENGVVYQLRLDGLGVLTPITGNGVANLVFSLPTSSYSGQVIDILATKTPCLAKASSNTLTVTVNPIPIAPGVTFTPSTYCEGQTITPPTITTPVGTSTYKWYSDATLLTLITTANGTAPTNTELGFNTATVHTTIVYVTETTSSNCTGPATTVTLTVNATPTAPGVTFNPSTYCKGQTITPPTITTPVGTSTYKWYSDAALLTLITTANGTAPTNTELGFNTTTVHTTIVYVTETNSSNCQSPATTVTLTVNATPTAPGVTFNPSTYCEGQTITPPTITTPVGTSTYKWYSDATLLTLITTADGKAPTNTELGFNTATVHTTLVYVTETNSSNCTGPAKTVTLTVKATPTAPGVTFNPSTYCEGQTITPPTITTPVGTSTYKWYSDATLLTLITTANGKAPTNTELGFNTATVHTTIVYVTETTSSNCTGPATTVTLTVNATPTAPGVTFTPSTYCEGQTITAPTITSPTGGSTYKWYSDATLLTLITTANGTAPTNTELGFNTATVHTTIVYVTETTSSNCQGSATTVTLTVNATPTAPGVTFNPSTYCEGQTITPPTITTPVGTSTYKWYSDATLLTLITTANGTAPTNTELGFNTATVHTTIVYVTETTSSNCTGPATTVTLTVNATPTAPGVTFNPSTYCEGQTITAPTITSPTGGSTYKWYSDATLLTLITTANGTAPTNTELGFNTATVHTTIVYVTETTSSNCTGPAKTVTLTVNATPSAPGVTFNPSTYCEGQTITPPTITTPVGTSTYKWYSDATLLTLITTADGKAPTNTELGFNTATVHTTIVYVTETNSSNCQSPAATVTLTVNATPTAPGVTFTPSTYCEGQTITPPTITTPVGTSTYKWYSDAALLTLITTANGTAPTNTELGFNTATVHTTIVYVTETTSSNCTGPATTVTLTVNATPTAPGVTFNPSTYCEGQTITAPTIMSPTGGSTYKWYSDGTLLTLITTADGTAPTNAELGFSSVAANVTTVYVTETNSSNCTGPAMTVTLTVKATPTAPGVTFNPSTYCEGQTITPPTITTPVGTSTYKWYSDATLLTLITTANGTAPTNTELGFNTATVHTTIVYVTETTSSNCTGPATTVTLTVNATPTAPGVTFTPSTYCEGQTITPPTITTPVGTSTYKWYSDATLLTLITTADGTVPTNAELGFSSVAANVTTVYVAETNSSNCQGPAMTVTLTVNANPVAPGVTFTPNTYCVGQAITSPTITTPVGTSTYKWYSDATLLTLITTADGTAPTNAELGFSSVAANVTTVYVTETNSSNCTGPATTVTLTVNAMPSAPGVTFNPSTYCEGQTITSPTITTPVVTSTYKWYSDATLLTLITTADGTAPSNAELGFNTATVHTTIVYVTETNSSNCEGLATTVTLTVNATPTAPGVTFNPSTYCEGQTITAPTITSPTGGSTYKWYSDATLLTLITTADGTVPTNAELGFSSVAANVTTVYVAETNSSNCQGPAMTVTLTVNANPVAPGVTFTPNTYCVGQAITSPTITTPVGTSTYKWYSDATLLTLITTADGTAPTNAELGFSSVAANVTTVYVTETNSSNCTGPATTVTLTVNATPSAPGVTFNPSTYCEGQTITPPTITTPVGTSTYKWYSDATLLTLITTADGTAPTNAELGFSSVAANVTTVYVAETTSSNCTGPATTVTLTVNATPTAPGVTFNPSTYCEGQTITAPTITSPTGGSTYKWYSDATLLTLITTADGTAPTNAELGFSSVAANVTTVYVTETNSSNCQGPAMTVTLTVNPLPVPTITKVDASCAAVNNGSIDIPSVAGTAGPWSYSIDGGVTTQLTVPFSNLSIGNYSVVVKDNITGCISSSIPITINALVTVLPTISKTDASCNGVTNGQINVSSITGGTAPYSYSNDNGSTFQTASAFTNLTGSTNYSILVKDNSGCLSSVNSIFIANTATITGTITKTDASSCVTNSGSIQVTSPVGGTLPYSYSIDNGNTFQTGNVFNGLAQGNYNVVIMDGGGCLSASVAMTIGTISNIVPVIGKTDATCAGVNNGSITVSSVTGGAAPYTYSNDNGVTFQASTTFSNLSGSSNFSVVVKDANGCISSAIAVIINSTITITGSLTTTDASCASNNGTITVNSPSGGTAPYSYSLDNGAFQTGTTFNGVSIGSHTVVIMDAGSCQSSSLSITINSNSNISPTIAKTDAACNGLSNGSISITNVSGGVGPYNYSIDNGVTFQALNSFSGLAASNYSIVVQDASLCLSSVFSVTLNNTTTITGSLTTTDASCASNNGTITVNSPSGGTAPYSYSLDNGTFQVGSTFNGVSIGSHTVVIMDAGSCQSSSLSITINSNSNISPTIAKTDAACNGLSNGSISITNVSGGVGPYNYSIDNGVTFQASNSFSGLAASNYSIVVQDASLCLSSVFSVTLNNTVTITGLLAKTDASCASNNGTITVNSPSGGTAPYSYSLDNGTFQVGSTFNGVSIGSHTVVIMDAGSCQSSSLSITINSSSNISPTIAKTDATCNGLSDGSISITSVSGGVGPYNYSIDNGVTFQASNSFSGLAANNYSILVQDASLCLSSVFSVTLNNTSSISGTILKTDETCAGGDGKIEVTSVTGGTSPFNYSNDNAVTFQSGSTFNNLVTGAYNVVVKDNIGCLSFPVLTNISLPSNCSGGGGGGGNVNCGHFNINVTEVRPSCSNQNNGQLSITISGGTPGPNYVLTLYDSVRVPHFIQAVTVAPSATFTFDNLSPSLDYYYKIDDGSTSCTLPYSLQIQTTISASAAGFVDAQCFNQPVGQATITVTSGGASPYSYSLDNGVTWVSFTSPYTITNLMPKDSTYSILVGDDPSDLCPAEVLVTIKNAVADITTSFTNTDASCSNNDGTIQVGAVSGGTGPYTYRLDSVDYASLPSDNTFTGLAGGTHKFTVIDAIGCSKYFKTTINFPGLVNLTTIFNNPDCLGNGNNGNIIVTITSSGTFDVGYTTNPVNDPSKFRQVVSDGTASVKFDSLSQGIYYVVAKPVGALCPSRSLPITIGGGPVAVDFNIIPEDFICFETKGTVRIATIKGSSLVEYNYQIISAGNIVQSGTITQLQALPPDTINYTDLDKGNYQMILFQDQSASSGCSSPVSSSYKSFSIKGPAASLDTLYVNRTFSLPNIATGSMLIGIQESQEEPYQLMLHLVNPHLQGQKNNYAFDSTWVSVSRNNQNLIMEFNAANIYGGDYRLSIRDTLGCTRTYDISLDFDKDLYVPNVFTPNNDGKNDTFQILNLPDNSKLVITNRWGKEVYQSSNYQSNWNGGSEVDGIYYYNLTAGGKVYTGWVEILHPSY